MSLNLTLFSIIFLQLLMFGTRYLIFEQGSQIQCSKQQHQNKVKYIKKYKFTETLLTIKSRVSCILETFNESLSSPGAALRSCKYEYLCFDAFRNNFIIFPSINHFRVMSMVHSSVYLSSIAKPVVVSTSSSHGDFTFTRPLYSKFRKNDKHYLLFDEVRDSLWIPLKISDTFQSVLWEVYFPIFSLMEILFLSSKSFHIFLLNERNSTLQRIREFTKLFQLPRLNVVPLPPIFDIENDKNEYLCFQNAAMGMGGHRSYQRFKHEDPAMDHHRPSEQIHRSNTMQRFRNYMLQLMNISTHRSRSLDLVYSSQVAWVEIIKDVLKEELTHSMSLQERVSIILQTKILLLASQEDKTVALFLPQRAHLIIIGQPNLDWDFWTNYIWIQVHNLQFHISEAITYIIDEVMFDNLERLSTFDSLHENTVQLNKAVKFYLVKRSPPITRIHCVAEKLIPNKSGAANYRSCMFRNLCYDLKEKEFTIFPSPAYARLLSTQTYLLKHGNYFSTVSQPLILSPSLKSRSKIKYGSFRVLTGGNNESKYYRFNGTWISVDTVRSCNPGHLIWDYWAPIFMLRHRFNISNTNLLITYGKNREKCKLLIRKSIEKMFGVPDALIPSMRLHMNNPESNYLCSDYSVSGFGWLNDHGISSHGWVDKDMNYPMNLHRGPEFFLLRSTILSKNHLLAGFKLVEPFIILFSIESSRDMRRCLSFHLEIQIAKQLQQKSNGLVSVHSFQHNDTNVLEQLELSSKASIFITASGGGSFPAFFLPKGSVLIIYGDKDMHLDSDLYNSYGHISVHWMSIQYQQKDRSLFIHLLCDEIENLLTRRRSGSSLDCGFSETL